MIKNYQKGVKGFTKVEPNRLRIKKFLFCQTAGALQISILPNG